MRKRQCIADHTHMLMNVPPKYSIAITIGYSKSKSAIRIHRHLLKKKETLSGRSFWARGYCVSTVGFDENQIKLYIKEQEQLQKDEEQLELDFDEWPLLGAFFIPPLPL
jgi:putative transposase